MHGFPTIQFKVITDFTQFKLLEAADYFALDGTHYRLPQYAGSDLASTPPAVWGPPLFLPPCGWYGPAVYGHDCGFQNTLLIITENGDGTESQRKAALTESQCNDLCHEMLRSLKPNPTPLEAMQIQAIYDGVTIGGWHAFKEDRS